MDPFFLPRALIMWSAFWLRFWMRHLGKRVVLTGLALTSLATLVLIIRDSF